MVVQLRGAARREPLLVLALLLVVLALLQLLHLLDDLRTDPTATLVSSLLKPQAVAGVGGSILAAGLVIRRLRLGRSLAVAVAGLVSIGFLLVHGIPVKAGPIHPYWGDGSADAVQWAGVVSIWACCAAVLWLARALGQRQSNVNRRPTASAQRTFHQTHTESSRR
jgi:hypothetical protein